MGHTTAMLRGANNVDGCCILVDSHRMGEYLKKQSPNIIPVTLDSHDLRGRKSPLLLDNGVIGSLLSESINEINRLESKVAELSKQV